MDNRRRILATISAIFSVSLLPSTGSGCPPSCIVCAENTTICRGLMAIPVVPLTTRALLLTDGTIASIEKPNLANLSSLIMLRLSNNGIVDIKEDAFHGLSGLMVLLLDQNQITSETVTESTFAGLPNLERLDLGSNAIGQINGTWFWNMANLGALDLGRNQIAKLEADTFSRSSLQGLQILDLSDNSIDYIAREAFGGLRGLRWLDLSRNRLSGMTDSFSCLSRLSVLNLDLNRWACTCRLHELAVFLRNFVKSPDRTLINGKVLVCQTAQNSEIQTVLQLADSNCATQSQNATIIVTSWRYRHYVRDVVLAALFCFAGAVGLTFAVATLLCNKRHQRRDPREKNGQLSGPGSHREGERIFERVPRSQFNCDSEVGAVSIESSISRPQLSQKDTVSSKCRQASNEESSHHRCPGQLNQGKEQSAGKDYFACQCCRLVHTFRTPSAGGEARRPAGKFAAGTTRGARDGILWGTKRTGPHQVEGANHGSTEGSRAGNECPGNSCYLSKEPMGICHPGTRYYKWLPDQLQSPSRYFPSLPRTRLHAQLGTVALGTGPFYEVGHWPFPPGRLRSAELLPGNDLSGNRDNHRQLLHFSNRVPTAVGKTVRSKVGGEPGAGSATRDVNAEPHGDILVLANRGRNRTNHHPFGKEGQRLYVKDEPSHGDSRLIDHIEILGTVWGGGRVRRPKAVTFDSPDFADAESTRSTEAGSERRGEGRKARASAECLGSSRRLRAEGTPLVRPRAARGPSGGARRRMDTKGISADHETGRAIERGASVNVLMVKFILHPTKHAKIHPGEVAGVKGPLRKKKQVAAKKKELTETHKRRQARKPPGCLSITSIPGLQPVQRPKTSKKRPSASSHNKPFHQPQTSTGPEERDGVREDSGSLHSDPGMTSGGLSPTFPKPVAAGECNKLPPSVKSPLGIHAATPQGSALSVVPAVTPSTPPSLAPAATAHKTPPSRNSAADAPHPPASGAYADGSEAKATQAGLEPITAGTSRRQGATPSSDSEGVKGAAAPPLGHAPGAKPSGEPEAGDAPGGGRPPKQHFPGEGDGQTGAEQSEESGPTSQREAAEGGAEGEARAAEGKPPSGSTPATAAGTHPPTGRGRGSPAAGALAGEAAARGVGGRAEEGAAEPAEGADRRPQPADRPPSLPHPSAAPGPRNQERMDGGSAALGGPDPNGDGDYPPLASPPGAREGRGSNVRLVSYEKDGEGMATGEVRLWDCTLLPIHSLGAWDGAADPDNPRRKIRLVIPERPGGESNNAGNRKVR